MRDLIITLGMAALLCSGCTRHYGDTTLYQLSGRQKPIVAVLPVINNTEQELTWDLSTEFTDEIRKRVYDSKKIYLLREGGSREVACVLSVPNPKALSKESMESLGAAQYVIVAEIVQQEQVPYGLSQPTTNPFRAEMGAVFSTALRVRIIDNRRETPKIILQEVLSQDFMVARAYMKADYSKTPWGSEAFRRTPMGMAHNRLIREMVARAEAYIEASL